MFSEQERLYLNAQGDSRFVIVFCENFFIDFVLRSSVTAYHRYHALSGTLEKYVRARDLKCFIQMKKIQI